MALFLLLTRIWQCRLRIGLELPLTKVSLLFLEYSVGLLKRRSSGVGLETRLMLIGLWSLQGDRISTWSLRRVPLLEIAGWGIWLISIGSVAILPELLIVEGAILENLGWCCIL